MVLRVVRSAGMSIRPEADDTVVAIGNFDGLHRGHQALFQAARTRAASTARPTVLTFHPHPSKVLSPALAPKLILRPDEREAGIARAGVELLAILSFDEVLARRSAAAFIDDVLVGWLRARAVVVGEGFRFGHKASGSVDDLRRAFGADQVIEVPAVRTPSGLVVSSSKIRELVADGRVEAAAELLGAPYFVEGVVVRGDQRGRTIGVPTANVDSGRELLPRAGVYASRARLDDGRWFPSVTNVGTRPTVAGTGVRVESHLLGGERDAGEVGDLYGRRLHVELVARLRDELRFSGLDALRAQIMLDIDDARRVLAGQRA